MTLSIKVDSSSTKAIYVTDPKWSDFIDENSTDIWDKVPLKISFVDKGEEVDYELPQIIMASLRSILTRVDYRGNLIPRHIPLSSIEIEMEPSIGFGIRGIYNFNEAVHIWLSEYLGDVSLSFVSEKVTQSYKCGTGSVGGEFVSSVFALKEFERNR